MYAVYIPPESAPDEMEVKHHSEQYKAPRADAGSYTPPQNARPTQPAQPAQRKEDEGKEESLTTLLNVEQRGELTLLIATTMAAMRKTINSSFDANVYPLSLQSMSHKLMSSSSTYLKTGYEV